MSRINRQPSGVLGFLGIKNTGRNPDQLGGTLSPTWDMADLYLVNGAEYITRNETVTAPSTFVGDGPTVGEVWHVHEYGARTNNLAAGETINFAVGVFGPAGTNVFVPTTSISAVSAVAGDRMCVAGPRPMILTPGETIGLFVTEATTAGSILVTVTARITRMRV